MKKVLFLLTIGLLSGVMMQSCKESDEKLQTQVNQVMQKTVPEVIAIVQNGVATLSGVVESEDTKMMLETLAKEVKGIKSVVNNVTVHKPEPPVTINPDDTIRTTIESKLKDAGFKSVFIDVNNGEVVLTGDAKRSDLTKIMQIANESNPKKVTNNLNLK
ncbi:MAG: BON domain-containing protein [Tannerella sp.]|jgi:osmotically-inducible protein OsmY|nr:BON domain-containing protein [Tannerella sp.]